MYACSQLPLGLTLGCVLVLPPKPEAMETVRYDLLEAVGCCGHHVHVLFAYMILLRLYLHILFLCSSSLPQSAMRSACTNER
ncbi:hypothetical protein F5X98DRAFT_329848 [Xylaria grammica]|nr:hypothetical protein F5X98DRAFT_329848 [Xylaria grammica]